MKSKIIKNADEIFVITRSFDASQELVFNAFTDPEHLMRWWGPRGFKMVYCKLNLRPGGMFHYCAQSPQGDALWGRFIYREISPCRRLIFVNSFSDEYGNLTPTPFPGWPQEMLNKVIFTEQHDKTIVTLTSEAIDATVEERKTFVSAFRQMKHGYNGTFDQLEKYLSGRKGVVPIDRILYKKII
jgi:uncharacterized protein YndB with AHSA1/START domain